MSIYFINLFLIIFWFMFLKLVKNNNRKVFLTISFFQLYLILALRSPLVGADTENYINYFNITKQFNFWKFDYSRLEYGYIFLNKILSFIQNEQIFIAIMAFIPLFIYFKFISRESKIPWLSVYLFITLGSYSDIFCLFRQSIALSIIAISYKYLKEDNLKKFVITIIIASFFHITSLVFLPVYFLRKNKLNYKNIGLYLGIEIVVLVTSNKIINFAINKFGQYDYGDSSGGGIKLFLMLFIVLALGLFFSKSVLNNDKQAIVLYNIMFCSIVVQLLALQFSLFTRLTSYFSLFLMIFIPEVIAGIKDKRIRAVAVFLVIGLAFIQYYMVLNKNLNGSVPYFFYFN